MVTFLHVGLCIAVVIFLYKATFLGLLDGAGGTFAFCFLSDKYPVTVNGPNFDPETFLSGGFLATLPHTYVPY